MQQEYLKYVLITILAFNILVACTNESEQVKRGESPRNEALESGDMGIKSSGESVFSTVSDKDNLSTFVKVLKAAGFEQMLSKNGPFTVFAPTNVAFNNLPDGIIDVLMKPENRERLATLLKVHIIEGSTMISDLKNEQLLKTKEGIEINIIKDQGTVTVSQAKIIESDIQASNGVVHIVDQFLVHLQPPVSNE